MKGDIKNGVERDSSKAFKLLKFACDKGFGASCFNIARMYRLGDGVERSEDMFNKYREITKEVMKRNAQTMAPGLDTKIV